MKITNTLILTMILITSAALTTFTGLNRRAINQTHALIEAQRLLEAQQPKKVELTETETKDVKEYRELIKEALRKSTGDDNYISRKEQEDFLLYICGPRYRDDVILTEGHTLLFEIEKTKPGNIEIFFRLPSGEKFYVHPMILEKYNKMRVNPHRD